MNVKMIAAFGEVLWDLLPSGQQLGGAPFNFCYRIHSLGMNSAMISRLGRDGRGEAAHQRITELGVSDAYMQWDNDHPTGTVDITLDELNQPDYTIITNVAYDYIQPTAAALQVVKQSDCICFGSLAQRNPASRETLMTLLEAAGDAVKLFDVNLRNDCYSTETIAASLQYAQIIKLNNDEAWMLRDMLDIEGDSLPALAKAMMERWSLQACLITLGDQGVYARNQSGECVYEAGFKVDLIDPCGSGDAFTAAFMVKWLNHAPLKECCLWGNALGAMVATQPGATTPIAPEEIEAFLKGASQRIVDASMDA